MPTVAPPSWFVGHYDDHQDSPDCVQLVDQGYDLVTVCITNDAFREHVLGLVDACRASHKGGFDVARMTMPLIPLLTPAYTSLGPDICTPYMLARVSPWIDLASSDPLVAHVSRQVLNQELAFAAFCGLSSIIIQGPQLASDSQYLPQYARAVAHALDIGPYLRLNIVMSICPDESDSSCSSDPASLLSRRPHTSTTHTDRLGSWDAWNTIRSICTYSSRLSICLKISSQLAEPEVQSRWYTEPIRLLLLPKSSFSQKGNGLPVLPIFTQNLLSRFMRLRQPPWLLLSDVDSTWQSSARPNDVFSHSHSPTPAEAASLPTAPKRNPHLQYIRSLQHNQPLLSPLEQSMTGYQDYLQSPLQPLSDNLESVTYEVFEKDPIKYEWYERAVVAALRDLHALLQRPLVVAVVGAGRGPLITRVLQASKSTSIPIEAYAVEKNPNAYVVLLHRNATSELWENKVKVTKSDMRSWPGPSNGRKVDILVSELLGSFADNELSPECLDGVQHVLDPCHGVSIPQSYTAHLTPACHPLIHAELRSRPTENKWSLPYVVNFDQLDFLSRQPLSENTKTDLPAPDIQQAWIFQHPVPQSVLQQSQNRRGGNVAGPGIDGGDGWNEHNSRACSLSFRAGEKGICHGLAGYFETILYTSPLTGQKIELSTNPNTMNDKSKDMISWFPIFFPIKAPLYVPRGSEVRVTMYRKTDDRKVWYEWLLEVFVELDGQAQRCGGSELHSSQKFACLI